jgi:hypothetical protein
VQPTVGTSAIAGTPATVKIQTLQGLRNNRDVRKWEISNSRKSALGETPAKLDTPAIARMLVTAEMFLSGWMHEEAGNPMRGDSSNSKDLATAGMPETAGNPTAARKSAIAKTPATARRRQPQ